MKTNSDYLIRALGWRRATLHTLTHITGLTVDEIWELDHAPDRLIAYRAGRRAVMLGNVLPASQGWRQSAEKGWRYDLWAYWRGVMDATKEKDVKR